MAHSNNAATILTDRADAIVTVEQAEAHALGERVFSFDELCQVALKIGRRARLNEGEKRQWRYLPQHKQEFVTEAARLLEADRRRVWHEVRTLRGAREFHTALGHVQPLLRVRVPRRAPAGGRPAGRRARRPAGSRGPPADDDPPGPPSRRGQLRHVSYALAAFLAEVQR